MCVHLCASRLCAGCQSCFLCVCREAHGASGEEQLSLEAFSALVSDPVWTLKADEDLVRLVNEQCDEAGVAPPQLSLHPPTTTAASFPEWFVGEGAQQRLRTRFAVLLALNRRLGQLLPLVDFTVTKPSTIVAGPGIVYPSALGRRVACLRSLAFTRTKAAFWNTVLHATVFATQQSQGDVIVWHLRWLFPFLLPTLCMPCPVFVFSRPL